LNDYVKLAISGVVLLFLVHLCFSSICFLNEDRRAEIIYSIRVEENGFVNRTVLFQGNGTAKLIIIYDDGRILEKKLPAYVGENEHVYGFLHFLIFVSVFFSVFIAGYFLSVLESVLSDLKRKRGFGK